MPLAWNKAATQDGPRPKLTIANAWALALPGALTRSGTRYYLPGFGLRQRRFGTSPKVALLEHPWVTVTADPVLPRGRPSYSYE